MTFQETEQVELKRVLNDTFERAVVAFLNTMDGTIYIGVEDSGTIAEVRNVDETLKKIADIITMQILPDPQSYVDLGTKFIDGKQVIEVKVRKGNHCITSKNTVAAHTGVIFESERVVAA